MSDALVNISSAEVAVVHKANALSKLFQLKPATLDLVAKATRQDNVTPGKLRVVQTNEHFDSMRAVILFEPTQGRKKYLKGQYSKDALDCYSYDNIRPAPKAKNPPAMYCETCPSGNLMWQAYRKAKERGVVGDALSALIPECKEHWSLLIADRATKLPYYLTVRGTSVKPFETAMQNVARLFQMIIANIKTEIRAGKAVTMPESVQDIIWQISFTLGVDQPIKGGQYVLGFKDFKVMSDEDKAEFGAMYQDFVQRRQAGQIQSQEAAEQEAADAAVSEPAGAPSAPSAASAVAEKNKKIQI
jgi:hypothetical protein